MPVYWMADEDRPRYVAPAPKWNAESACVVGALAGLGIAFFVLFLG